MSPHDRAELLAALRIGVGAVLFLAPGAAARPWVGAGAATPATRTVARGLAARDLALGLGGLLALRRGAPARGWLEAAALADTGDALATLAAWRHLPRGGRRATLVAAAGAAAAAASLARALPPAGR